MKNLLICLSFFSILFLVTCKPNEITPDPILTVQPASIDVAATAGTTPSINITCNNDWTASTDNDWLSATTNKGTGNGSLTCTFKANTLTTSRSGKVIISSSSLTKEIIVNQAGIQASLSLDIANKDLTANSGNFQFNITSNIAWTITADSWITLNQTSGNGNQQIIVNYSENANLTARTANISITGSGLTKTISINQVAGTITVTSPANWLIGTNPNIQWTTNFAGNVKIELFKNASLINTIVSSTSNSSQSYSSWTLPTSTSIETGYKVRITSLTNNAVFGESSFFPIINTTSTTVTDYDGNVYQIVAISGQTWFKENLKSKHYSDGTTISVVYPANGDENNVPIYGRIYDWNSTMKNSIVEMTQGACPTGWHLPSDAEWKTLELYVGMTQAQVDATDARGNKGGELKEIGTTHWLTPNVAATNNSGFTALPANYKYPNGSFNGTGQIAIFWTSSQSGLNAWSRSVAYNFDVIYRTADVKTSGYSIRCIKNQ